MAVGGFLGHTQSQELRQTISAQQIQYVTLLQMTLQELNDNLNDLEIENPLVEIIAPERIVQDMPSSIETAQWLTAKPSLRPDEDPADFTPQKERQLALADDTDDLQAYLRNQFDFSLTNSDLALLEKLICSIDENGYLSLTTEQASKTFGVDIALVEEAVAYLKTLDPPGICAADLSDTLSVQLERKGITDQLAYRLVQDHLYDLSRGHFQKIASAFNCPLQKIHTLYDVIKTLNPRPASCFGNRPPVYILPDVTIEEADGKLHCRYNDHYSARINVNRDYLALCSKGEDVRQYVERKLSQALWMSKAIQTRRDTIEQIATLICQKQCNFFLHHGEILPLRLKDIAAELDIHESTVSRSISGKYLECKYGVYPFKHFFSRAINEDKEGQSMGSHSVKEQIKCLIEAEDPSRPLSDSAIAGLLEKSGTVIARRTVAKYREDMGFPSSSLRKAR